MFLKQLRHADVLLTRFSAGRHDIASPQVYIRGNFPIESTAGCWSPASVLGKQRFDEVKHPSFDKDDKPEENV